MNFHLNRSWKAKTELIKTLRIRIQSTSYPNFSIAVQNSIDHSLVGAAEIKSGAHANIPINEWIGDFTIEIFSDQKAEMLCQLHTTEEDIMQATQVIEKTSYYSRMVKQDIAGCHITLDFIFDTNIRNTSNVHMLNQQKYRQIAYKNLSQLTRSAVKTYLAKLALIKSKLDKQEKQSKKRVKKYRKQGLTIQKSCTRLSINHDQSFNIKEGLTAQIESKKVKSYRSFRNLPDSNKVQNLKKNRVSFVLQKKLIFPKRVGILQNKSSNFKVSNNSKLQSNIQRNQQLYCINHKKLTNREPFSKLCPLSLRMKSKMIRLASNDSIRYQSTQEAPYYTDISQFLANYANRITEAENSPRFKLKKMVHFKSSARSSEESTR